MFHITLHIICTSSIRIDIFQPNKSSTNQVS